MTEQEQKPKRRGGSRSGRKITQLSLTSLAGLIKEAGIVYRLMRADRLNHDKGRSLVWVLAQMRAMLEAQHLERIEAKLSQLQAAAETKMITVVPNGHDGPNQPARLPN